MAVSPTGPLRGKLEGYSYHNKDDTEAAGIAILASIWS